MKAPIEAWLIFAGLIVCISLLVRAGVDFEHEFGPGPIAQVSR
jgi:hypothetical protein